MCHALLSSLKHWWISSTIGQSCRTPEEKPDNTYWNIHFDGSRQLEGSGDGVVLASLGGDKFCYVLRLMFRCTNNAAEYEALLHGLRMAKQVSGTWDSKDPLMDQLSGPIEVNSPICVIRLLLRHL